MTYLEKRFLLGFRPDFPPPIILEGNKTISYLPLPMCIKIKKNNIRKMDLYFGRPDSNLVKLQTTFSERSRRWLPVKSNCGQSHRWLPESMLSERNRHWPLGNMLSEQNRRWLLGSMFSWFISSVSL
jgi:hypothetical protein